MSDEYTKDLIGIAGLVAASIFIGIVALASIPIALCLLILYPLWRWYSKPDYSDLHKLQKLIDDAPHRHVRYRINEALDCDLSLSLAVFEICDWEQIDPPTFPAVLTPIEAARYKDRAAQYLNEDPDAFVLALTDALRPFVHTPPPGLFSATRQLKLEEIENVHYRFYHPRYFRSLHRQLMANLDKAKTPEDYVADTPLQYLLERPTSVNLTHRFEHTHLLGSTGSGKTQLIQYLISEDLKTDCCVIVVDSQRQMIPKLASLGYDMQLISPKYPLALNLFDMPRSHTTVPLLQYVLSGLMNAPLTPKQELIFQFATTVLVANRGTIYDFQNLLRGEPPDLSKVDDTTRLFFETEFYSKGQTGFEATRKEIGWRVWSLLKNPTLRDMFAAKENRCALDLSKKLILIDTDIDVLQDYSGLFGRFFLAQLMLVAQERFQGSHTPVYAYLDEAYAYFDTSVVSMLETARKAKIGLTLAHQYLGQIKDPQTSAAIMSLTATKLASQLSPSDAHAMAQAMRVRPEYIQDLRPLHFALWQKGSETLSIEVPVGVVEALPKHDIPHADMIARYGRPPDEPKPPEPEQPPEPDTLMVDIN